MCGNSIRSFYDKCGLKCQILWYHKNSRFTFICIQELVLRYKISFRVVVCVLWIHKGYFVINKLVLKHFGIQKICPFFQVLPQVAAEVSAPISQTNKITMVNSGDGPVGASRMTGEILEIMGSLPDTVEKMTGVNITKVWWLTYIFWLPANLDLLVRV